MPPYSKLLLTLLLVYTGRGHKFATMLKIVAELHAHFASTSILYNWAQSRSLVGSMCVMNRFAF